MSAELKICPFCGAAAMPVTAVVEGKVWATSCSAKQLGHSANAMSWTSADHCAEVWNRRATPAPGAPAGWINVSDRLPVCNHEDIYIGINTAGFAGAFNAIQEIDGTLYCLYGTPEEEHSVMSDLQWWQRMPAAPGAPGQEAAFPPRILALLHEVADRVGTEFRGPFEDGNGEPLQDDADAALAWIARQEAAAVQAVGAAWMSCESRGPWARNSLRAQAEGMRASETRLRKAYRKDYLGEPCEYIADAYAAAAAVFEAALAALPPSGAGEKTS